MSKNSFLDALTDSLPASVEVIWRPETGSTNDDLKAAARQNAFTHPVLLTVERQNAGRGTHGRGWRMAELAMIFSLGLPLRKELLSAPPGILSIAAAMSIAQSASMASTEKVLVKWPNDIWTAGGKAGGILIETVGDAGGDRSVVIGAGLNLSIAPGGVTTAGWPIRAISTRVSMNDPTMRGELLGLIVSDLLHTFNAIEKSNDFSEIVDQWPLYDAFYGKSVAWRTLDKPDVPLEGMDKGIDAFGRLILQGRRGEQSELSGELVSLLGNSHGE